MRAIDRIALHRDELGFVFVVVVVCSRGDADALRDRSRGRADLLFRVGRERRPPSNVVEPRDGGEARRAARRVAERAADEESKRAVG